CEGAGADGKFEPDGPAMALRRTQPQFTRAAQAREVNIQDVAIPGLCQYWWCRAFRGHHDQLIDRWLRGRRRMMPGPPAAHRTAAAQQANRDQQDETGTGARLWIRSL